MTYEIDVTPANDPLGTILTTLGDGDLLAGTRFRPVKLGTGMVQVVIDADSAKAGALEDEVYLRIRDTVIGSYIYSGSLSNAQIKLVSERKDRRVLTWSGLGALGPLARMSLGEDIYALGPPVQTARGSYDVPGMWTWTNQPYGAIGRRMFEEGRDHPDNPFAGMTVTFDRDGQTGGAPWTLFPTLHQEQVGTNVLDAYVNLVKAGVIFELTPGLVLNGYETFGSDHSGPAFAADVVRFMVGASALDSAANILTDAERAWSSMRVSELIVVGADNVTVKVNDPTAPFGKVGVYHYPQSNDPAVLTAVGNAELQRRLLRTIGALKLPVILENDPPNGKYLPGPGRPLWPANTVSAFTGGAAYDFDAAFPVAALDFLLTDAYGWTCEAELGTPFIDNAQRAKDFAVRQIIKSSVPARHPHPEMLCQALTAGAAPTVESTGYIGTSPTAITSPASLTDSILIVFAQDANEFSAAAPFTASYGGTALTAIPGSTVEEGIPASQAFYMLNPPEDADANGALLSVKDSALNELRKGYIILSGVNQSDPIGAVVTATGSGTTGGCGEIGGGSGVAFLNAIIAHGGASAANPTPDGSQTQAWASSGVNYNHESGGGYGNSNPTWTLSVSKTEWIATGLAVNGSGGSNGGRHPDLTGTETSLARCDHGHVVHSTSTPGVNDDASAGFVRGDFWAVVDDATTPTEITAVYELFDATEGAAVWLLLPSGGTDDQTAAEVPFTPAGTIAATDTQAAVEEVASDAAAALTAHTGDATDAHDASAISIADAGGHFAGTDVEAALQELGAGGGGGGVTVEDEGTPLATTATTLDFVGAGVTATGSGAEKTITIPGGGSGITVEEVDGSPSDTVTKLILPNGTVSIVGSTATYTPASGGGVDWSADVNESGASFANFTANTGTWSSTGTVIQQTNAGGAHMRARYNTKLPLGLPTIVECELKVVSGGNNVGFLVGYDGAAGAGGIGVSLNDGTNVIQVENGAIGILDTIATTITTGTFYKVRALINGPWVTIYVDGTLLGTVAGTNPGNDGFYVGLWTWTAAGEFRNFKVWTLSTGLPA